MNYVEWAEEYMTEARRVLGVIEKKKGLLNDRKLNKDACKQISDIIITYRCIYREMLAVAEHLRTRAGGNLNEA
jgi:hypothetical protein